jgi:hypothetical protein
MEFHNAVLISIEIVVATLDLNDVECPLRGFPDIRPIGLDRRGDITGAVALCAQAWRWVCIAIGILAPQWLFAASHTTLMAPPGLPGH